MNARPNYIAAALLAGLCVVTSTLVSAGTGSPARAVERAQQTTTVLTNALVAAVVSISDAVPAGSSMDDIEAASQAISILVPECQAGTRLVDATGNPLDPMNLPSDRFEARGLMALQNGAPMVQEVVGGTLRTLVPLTNDMHPNCATCHTSYSALPAATFVGAAGFNVGL